MDRDLLQQALANEIARLVELKKLELQIMLRNSRADDSIHVISNEEYNKFKTKIEWV